MNLEVPPHQFPVDETKMLPSGALATCTATIV